MSDNSRVRVSIVGIVVVVLFSTLLARLWFLQSGSENSLKVQAVVESTRTLQTESPRGEIKDINGNTLVADRASWAVTVDRDLPKATLMRVFGQLAEQLGIPTKDLQSQYNSNRQSPLEPAVVAHDVTRPDRLAILQDPQDYPGVQVKQLTVRSYPQGNLGSQVLGYVGEVPADQLKALQQRGYLPGDEIGRAGVEAAFERDLRGQPQQETIEVDPTGQQVGPPVDVKRGEAGKTVYLTLDKNAQRAAETSLEQGILSARTLQDEEYKPKGYRTLAAPAGAVVVMDADTGAVVADASYPTYPLKWWVGGISQPNYDYLIEPNIKPDVPCSDRPNGCPLLDRATQGVYAPGSTFKLVTSLAMTKYGIRSVGEYYDDIGHADLEGSRFNNAGNGEVFGQVDLQRALTVSSDAYFYTVGNEFWKRWKSGDSTVGMGLQTEARELGFGAATGYELDEAPGRITDPEWKKRFADANYKTEQDRNANGTWYPYDDILPAVGQGDNVVTPLQLANAYAAFTNGGTLWHPQIESKVVDADGTAATVQPKAIRHIDFDPTTRATMMAGFQGAISDPKGTAYQAFQGFPLDQVPVAGKTGTTQVKDKGDTSLFVGMFGGTVAQPKYVVAVVVEQGEFSARPRPRITRRIIERMSGLPAPPVVAINQGID